MCADNHENKCIEVVLLAPRVNVLIILIDIGLSYMVSYEFHHFLLPVVISMSVIQACLKHV